jgi:hypothetical protein
MSLAERIVAGQAAPTIFWTHSVAHLMSMLSQGSDVAGEQRLACDLNVDGP